MIKRLKLCLRILFISIFFLGCGSDSNNSNNLETENDVSKKAFLAFSDSDYLDLGLKKDSVEVWEDGMRSNGKSGSFEWWYSDFIFSDGTTVAVVFYTKFIFNTYGPAHPMVSITIQSPNGKTTQETYLQSVNTEINASKLFPDVHIGKSYLTYHEGNYQLHFEKDNLIFDATMISTLPMIRAKTGFVYFGESKEKYFAWLPAQASSNVKATLSKNGVESNLLGIGYHDHNWGNSPMNENINSWYWGRAKVGEYTLVFSEIVAHEDFNNSKIPLLLIGKKDKYIKLKGDILVTKSNEITHPSTNKSYATTLTFTQKDENGLKYTIVTKYKQDITFLDMNLLPFEIGKNPTYLRSLGDINLTITERNNTQKSYLGQAILEQMSFDDTIVP